MLQRLDIHILSLVPCCILWPRRLTLSSLVHLTLVISTSVLQGYIIYYSKQQCNKKICWFAVLNSNLKPVIGYTDLTCGHRLWLSGIPVNMVSNLLFAIKTKGQDLGYFNDIAKSVLKVKKYFSYPRIRQ